MTMCYPTTTDWTCVGTPEEIEALDPALKARSEMLAWNSLARLTGFRLSLCPTTVRPCATRCNPGIWTTASVSGWDGYSPYISGGVWYNACGCRPNSCSCTTIQEIVLPDPEVSGPVVVTLNGAVLDPSAYRVDNGNRLVRQDGQAWPLCQDMNEPTFAPPTFEPVNLTWPLGATATVSREGDLVTAVVTVTDPLENAYIPLPEVFGPQGDVLMQIVDRAIQLSVSELEEVGQLGMAVSMTGIVPVTGPVTFQWLADPVEPVAQDNTFTVSYYSGVGPDAMLDYAAGLLAGEWYKACQGRDCRLPSTATQVVRQGVTFTIPSFDTGTSGILEVDNIVANYNPFHLKIPSRVISVDSLRARKRTA